MVEGNAAARMFMPVQGFALSKLAQVRTTCWPDSLGTRLLRALRMAHGPRSTLAYKPAPSSCLFSDLQLLYMHHLAHLLDCSSAHVVVHAVHPGLTQEGLNR